MNSIFGDENIREHLMGMCQIFVLEILKVRKLRDGCVSKILPTLALLKLDKSRLFGEFFPHLTLLFTYLENKIRLHDF